MNIDQWRASSQHRQAALTALSDPNVVEWLRVAEHDGPHSYQRTPAVSDGFGATYQLGRIRGYLEAFAVLRMMGTQTPVLRENIPTTWNAEEEPEKTDPRKNQ